MYPDPKSWFTPEDWQRYQRRQWRREILYPILLAALAMTILWSFTWWLT